MIGVLIRRENFGYRQAEGRQCKISQGKDGHVTMEVEVAVIHLQAKELINCKQNKKKQNIVS